ncbi:transcriptional repressor [Candidatus Poribacteria bacterium]|jgi:Fur family transcriptional regulator, peroxide stress response regulator|nr:transcriptional repressor [Candidatus Poribacteria bacterium]MBT5712591.1 transcriptional repressor [Candidatus Poribacteria bacterium]MBT7096220.1 transcriptional repressor [Candidatus Poribacteria bacterium]
MTALAEQLRRAGFRVTPQRLAIYDCLHEADDHPTAEQIHDVVRRRFPRISLATVYSGIDALANIGAVRKILRDAHSARYDAGSEEHAHFLCRVCDRVANVPMPALSDVGAAEEIGEVIMVNVEFVGICAACRRRKLGLNPVTEQAT